MAVGVKEEDSDLLLVPSVKFQEEPYASSRARKSFVPGCKDLQKEALRRSNLFGKVPPKCKNWKIERVEAFLVGLPIMNETDIAYLRTEVLAFRNALSNARTEQENIATGRAWTNESYLRLAHVLIEDDVKTAFLQRHECLDRNGLDGRNSENRLPTFEEVCAAKFNDRAYKPVTVEAPTLH
jgi:hypothetical protein